MVTSAAIFVGPGLAGPCELALGAAVVEISAAQIDAQLAGSALILIAVRDFMPRRPLA